MQLKSTKQMLKPSALDEEARRTQRTSTTNSRAPPWLRVSSLAGALRPKDLNFRKMAEKFYNLKIFNLELESIELHQQDSHYIQQFSKLTAHSSMSGFNHVVPQIGIQRMDEDTPESDIQLKKNTAEVAGNFTNED